METVQQSNMRLSIIDSAWAEDYSFFLFINSSAGGGLGMKILQQQILKIQFILQMGESLDHRNCFVYFYNLKNENQRVQGFKNIKQTVMSNYEQIENKIVYRQNKHKCYAIVCGGDGTIMWVVSEIIKTGIDIIKVPIGVIPLGTGNDFSRQLGWGGTQAVLLEQNYKHLKKLIRMWIHAKEEYFDIWDLQAEVFDNGKFQKVKNNKNQSLEGKTINRTFCNYFSFGIDGKVGYSFDRYRTNTRMGNLAVYGIMGMIKTLTKTKTIDQLIESMEISLKKTHSQNNINENYQKSLTNVDMIETNDNISKVDNLSNSTIYKSSLRVKNQKSQEKDDKFFKDGFHNILMLNVNSYSGGVKDIWKKASPGFLNESRLESSEVATGDGKIQIVSFPSSISIALERGIGGFSKKVSQGDGPFAFKFREYENQLKHRTYLQVDGQFIRFTHPKQINVKHSELVPNGKIKVLRMNQKYSPNQSGLII